MKNRTAHWHRIVARLVERTLRRQIVAALDLELATPQERVKLIEFVASQVSSMDDASVCYGAYAAEALGKRPEVKVLRDALIQSYRKRLLKWFGFAINQRAQQGGGGTGIKRLKDGIAAFIEDLPAQLLRGYKPMSQYIEGNISEIIEGDKLDAVSAKIFRVLSEASKSSGIKVAKAGGLSVAWDAAQNIWYIPPSLATFPLKDEIRRSGFRWDPKLKRWETTKLTPAMSNLIEMPADKTKPEAPGKPEAIRSPGALAELTNWFFGAWLPANIGRFDTVFNTYLKSKETSYTFRFKLNIRKVDVDIKRELAGPKDAVEELRYRYLGRQGRQPWLEVLDRYVDLTRASDPLAAMGLIDRMNNLQHSNGLFLEHFPKNVMTWYGKFLDRKYSARTAFILAGFIPDSDLREVIRFFDQPDGMRGQQQGTPDIEIQKKKEIPNAVNWREKGYPHERGFKQPSRSAPEVQRDIGHLPTKWDTQG